MTWTCPICHRRMPADRIVAHLRRLPMTASPDRAGLQNSVEDVIGRMTVATRTMNTELCEVPNGVIASWRDTLRAALAARLTSGDAPVCADAALLADPPAAAPTAGRDHGRGPGMRTQCDRLRDYLRDHPGASSLEITLDLAIVNVTGRVSDLRARGVEVECFRRQDGRDGYRIPEAPRQQVMGL